MFYADHPPPHFHVAYGEHEAVIRIDTLETTRGRLLRRALALVVEWALLHRDDLPEDWRRAESGEPLLPVEPLE